MTDTCPDCKRPMRASWSSPNAEHCGARLQGASASVSICHERTIANLRARVAELLRERDEAETALDRLCEILEGKDALAAVLDPGMLPDGVRSLRAEHAAARARILALEFTRQLAPPVNASEVAGAWVPVGERLPELGAVVVVRYFYGYEVGHRTPKNFRNGEGVLRDVTHWMALPKPPVTDAEPVTGTRVEP